MTSRRTAGMATRLAPEPAEARGDEPDRIFGVCPWNGPFRSDAAGMPCMLSDLGARAYAGRSSFWLAVLHKVNGAAPEKGRPRTDAEVSSPTRHRRALPGLHAPGASDAHGSRPFAAFPKRRGRGREAPASSRPKVQRASQPKIPMRQARPAPDRQICRQASDPRPPPRQSPWGCTRFGPRFIRQGFADYQPNTCSPRPFW